MCGIAGAIGCIDSEVRRAVGRMHDGQRHRGPDAEGEWSQIEDGHGVLLAHRRLSILDLSGAADQPMLDGDGRVLVFNGEIYNYRELASDLVARGQACRASSDTAVLMAAAASYGDEFLGQLRGMFAFALWDPQRRRLLLARDRLGIKPLYTVRVQRPGGETLLFASELRALLHCGLVERQLDPRALATYLWNGFVHGGQSLIRGVTMLPPASSLSIEWPTDGSSLRTADPASYWSLSRTGSEATSDRGDIARVLEESVRQHLASDVPLGVFLSGGVDSSAVACIASRVAQSKVATFNIAFEESGFDESPYARAVADQLGTEHHEILLTAAAFRDGLDRALAAIDQPTFDAINTWFVSRAVREAGITVALAGTGGDELFGGYSSYVDLPRLARMSRVLGYLPRPLLDRLTRMVSRRKLGPPGAVAPQVRWGKLGDALSTRGDMTAAYQVSYGLFTSEFLDELRNGATAQGTRWGMLEEEYRELRDSIRGRTPREQVALLELHAFLGERLLRDTDAASMDVSLEVRVPLLDHVLVETVDRCEDGLRFDPPRSKQLLRQVALGGLDPSLFDRPKSGFVLPIERWCRNLLRDELDRVFADRELAASVGVDPDAIQRLWRAFQDDAPGIYWSRVWSLYVLLRWCREHEVRAA